MSKNGLVDLIECVDFAAVKHKDQKRKDSCKSPYINQPIGVARILAMEAGIDDLPTLQGAVLHDCVEDTDATLEDIEAHFGKEVHDIVAEVTPGDDEKSDSISKSERTRLEIERSARSSPKAKLILLAGHLYNLRDIAGVFPESETNREEKVRDYFQWFSNVLQGLRGSCKVFEDGLDILYKQYGVTIIQ